MKTGTLTVPGVCKYKGLLFHGVNLVLCRILLHMDVYGFACNQAWFRYGYPEDKIIGASLSEPHIDDFAVEFVYFVRCAISHFWQKLFTNCSARRHKTSTSLIAIARTESTRGPTYSMARVIGATAWHFVCQCHYLCCHSHWKSLVTWTDLFSGHFNEGYRMS